MMSLLGTRSRSAHSFAKIVAGDVSGFDPGFLERHGLAAWALAAGMKDARLRAAVATQLAHEQDPRGVLDALRGLRVIGIKGLDYARRLYPAPELRPMGDHDLLVPATEYAEALRRLRALGFRDALAQTGVARHAGHYAAQLVRGRHHLDLHRSIRQTPRAAIPYDAIFARAIPDPVLAIAWLDPIDRLLIHCAHIAAHECVVPLIAYLDLEMLLRETPISAEAFARARVWRTHNALSGVLAMRARLHGWQLRGPPLLPSPREIDEQRRPPRPLQLIRKASLMDGAPERLRFAAYAVAGYLRRPAHSSAHA